MLPHFQRAPRRPQPPAPRPQSHERTQPARRRAPRPDYPAEFDQVAGAYARRIIREFNLQDSTENWRRMRGIILDVLVPREDESDGLQDGL